MCYILQPVGAGLDVFGGRPKLSAWRDRLRKELGEKLFDEAHELIMNMSSLPQKLQNNSAFDLMKLKFQKMFI